MNYDEIKEISYLLLKNEYLKMLNLDSLNESKLLRRVSQFFPDNWEIEYNIDIKIKLLSMAIKEKTNLIDIVESFNKLR